MQSSLSSVVGLNFETRSQTEGGAELFERQLDCELTSALAALVFVTP